MLSDPFKNQVFQRAYATVPKINLFDDEVDPHTDYQAVIYNSHPSAVDLTDCSSVYGFNLMWYATYLVMKPIYYKILWIVMDWVLETISDKGKILIYIGTNQAIQMTYWWLRYMYPRHSIGIFTTLTKKENKRRQLDKKIILSTAKSAGAALDIRDLEVTIDIDDPAKSPVVVRQKLGRTRDLHTTFFDIVDVGFPQLRYYYESKQPIFAKYAKRILPPIILNDVEIRERLMAIRQRDEQYLKDFQEKNKQYLLPVMEFRKQVMVFEDPEKNKIQY